MLHLFGLVALEKLFIRLTLFKVTDGEGIDETDPILLNASLSFFKGRVFIGGGFSIYFGTGSNNPLLPFVKGILPIWRMRLDSKDFRGLSPISSISINSSELG